MEWLHHPKYRNARDEVVRQFKSSVHSFRKLEHVVFLCGAANSSNREKLAAYLNKSRKDVRVFYADNAWLHLAECFPQAQVNALGMEELFAKLADIVPIVVESPGTFTELGAFSLAPGLRKKLLPIIDAQFKGVPSFVNTGPVRWIDADSQFRPSIFVNFSIILDAAKPLEERLDRLGRPQRTKSLDLKTSPKHLLFFLCDLISVVGPTTPAQLKFYTEKILGDVLENVEGGLVMLLSLGVALRLFRSVRSSATSADASQIFYYPNDGNSKPYIRRKFFNIHTERIRVMAALQSIKPAREALALVK